MSEPGADAGPRGDAGSAVSGCECWRIATNRKLCTTWSVSRGGGRSDHADQTPLFDAVGDSSCARRRQFREPVRIDADTEGAIRAVLLLLRLAASAPCRRWHPNFCAACIWMIPRLPAFLTLRSTRRLVPRPPHTRLPQSWREPVGWSDSASMDPSHGVRIVALRAAPRIARADRELRVAAVIRVREPLSRDAVVVVRLIRRWGSSCLNGLVMATCSERSIRAWRCGWCSKRESCPRSFGWSSSRKPGSRASSGIRAGTCADVLAVRRATVPWALAFDVTSPPEAWRDDRRAGPLPPAFTGGVGGYRPEVRGGRHARSSSSQAKIDPARNQLAGEREISTPDATVRTFVVTAREGTSRSASSPPSGTEARMTACSIRSSDVPLGRHGSRGSEPCT